MPETHLLWHYRSRHESLIAFSNMEYYENHLMTFPSAADNISRVHFVEVKGFYDRGRTRTNRAEAEAVVAEVIRRYSDPLLAKRSVGIVTFSIVQQNLIEDLLSDAFRKNPKLDEAVNGGEEPLFVKNLENVQGDERDVILFSVGYGPDKNGNISYNFGPLNKEGGWRRLNVAVSRARYEMTVFSTLRYDRLDLAATSAPGVVGLRNFLEFAANGRVLANINSHLRRVSTDGIGRLLCEHLRKKGYEVRQNIGKSDFRIDVGVVNPKHPERYLLGILLDGENYRSGETVRDREIARVEVLQGLEWNICRIWSVDCWDDFEREMKKVDAAVENALHRENDFTGSDDSSGPENPHSPEISHGPHDVTPSEIPPFSAEKTSAQEKVSCNASLNVKKEEKIPAFSDSFSISEDESYGNPDFSASLFSEPASEGGSVYYTPTILKDMSALKDEFYKPSFDEFILSQMRSVLEMEAPIEKTLFFRRLISAWGFGRFGSHIEARLSELLSRLSLRRSKAGEAVFLWKEGQNPENFRICRLSKTESESRDIQDIPPQEIAAAAAEILKAQIGMETNDLIAEIIKFMHLSSGGASRLLTGIDFAVQKGWAKRSGTRISIP